MSIKYERTYICVCGKEFQTANSFNGHKAQCLQHQIQKHGSLEFYTKVKRSRDKKQSETQKRKFQNLKQQKLEQWISEKHICEKCGEVMTEKYGSGRFCSKVCANSHQRTEESKKKTSKSIQDYNTTHVTYGYRKSFKSQLDYMQQPNLCIICKAELPYNKRYNKCCSVDCLKIFHSKHGLKNAELQSNIRRSKNEIAFCQLCENYFENVEHNRCIFNGWDADVIIHDIKYAILWNGIWHYKKIRKQQSLEQIQSRDSIKVKNIVACGYTPYIIKDLGSYDLDFVKDRFNEFIKYIENNKL